MRLQCAIEAAGGVAVAPGNGRLCSPRRPQATDAMAQTRHGHELFHEARRRAGQPQAPIKHRASGSLLLPAPNNIIFELFNTVLKEPSPGSLLEFVSNGLKEYLNKNWNQNITKQIVRRLRREQLIDLRAGLVDAPAIKSIRSHPESLNKPSSPSIIDTKPEHSGRDSNVNQVSEHILWRIRTGNVSQITSLLIKLVLDEGYRSGKLQAAAYDDVAACFEDWRSQKLIKLYSFGSAPPNDQKLILASTSSGDLTRWIANYIDGTEKRQKPDLIKKLASVLRDRTRNCIYITNELLDAINSLETGVIRCAFVVDRLGRYNEPWPKKVEQLLVEGKLFFMTALACVEFAPDPSSDSCC